MKHTATFGPISEATLRNQDLAATFADHLDWLNHGEAQTAANTALIAATRQALERFEDETLTDQENEEVGDELAELVAELEDALQDFAPPYSYFGAAEGDGACFGFWPDLESVQELPQYDDLNDVPEDFAGDFYSVNDHGNVSLYSREKGKEPELVWDIV